MFHTLLLIINFIKTNNYIIQFSLFYIIPNYKKLPPYRYIKWIIFKKKLYKLYGVWQAIEVFKKSP